MKFGVGQQYENPPAGSHIARCIALIDLGTQQHAGCQGREGWASRDVRITFELPSEKMTGIYNPEVMGKPFAVHVTVKQSLHASARLTKLLTGWRGRAFTKEEIEKFDPKNLLGKPCRISLIENGDYVNVDGISPLGKGEKCQAQVNGSVYFSLSSDEFKQDVFDKLGEKTREKIQKSPEWSALAGSSGDEGQEGPSEDVPHEQEDGPF